MVCCGARKNVVCCGDTCSIGRCATHVHFFFVFYRFWRCAMHVIFFGDLQTSPARESQDFARKSTQRHRSQGHPKTSLRHHPTIFLLFCFRFSVILISFSHLFSNIFCTHFRLFVFAFFFLLKPVWDFGHNALYEIVVTLA